MAPVLGGAVDYREVPLRAMVAMCEPSELSAHSVLERTSFLGCTTFLRLRPRL